MANAQHVGHYQFSFEDQLFFDTNIWISLFNCRSDPKKQENESLVKIHAGALKRAKKAGSQLFTHPIVAAEFVNRIVRDEHNFLHIASNEI